MIVSAGMSSWSFEVLGSCAAYPTNCGEARTSEGTTNRASVTRRPTRPKCFQPSSLSRVRAAEARRRTPFGLRAQSAPPLFIGGRIGSFPHKKENASAGQSIETPARTRKLAPTVKHRLTGAPRTASRDHTELDKSTETG